MWYWVNPSNFSIILILVYIPAYYPHISIRLLLTATQNLLVLHQMKSLKLTWHWTYSLSRSILTGVYTYTHQLIAQSQTNDGKEHPRQEIWVLAQTFIIQVTPLALMSLSLVRPVFSECLFQARTILWPRLPELLMSPPYSSGHFLQGHWNEQAPREQMHEVQGGIILAIWGNSKMRSI